MEWLGDLERSFATAIYPNKALVAIAAIGLIALLALVARRRRWDQAIRRHPFRTAAGMAVVLAIVGPIAWYLGSPLVLSTTIDEPAPALAVKSTVSPSVTLPATESPTSSPTNRPSPRVSASQLATLAPTPRATPTQTVVPALGERSGRFSGADEFHFGRGTARLIETAPGTFTVRLERFEVRNGPDLYVYLSPSAAGYAKGAVQVGRLKADRGNQNYPVPQGIDTESFRSVVIWCKEFGVLFATARLN